MIVFSADFEAPCAGIFFEEKTRRTKRLSIDRVAMFFIMVYKSFFSLKVSSHYLNALMATFALYRL